MRPMLSRMQTWAVESPDGQVAIEVALGDDGALSYQVRHHGRTVVRPSRLGVVDGAVTLAEAGPAGARAEAYEKVSGKQRSISVEFAERTLRFAPALEMDLRAYDDGVAFRYRIPGAGTVTVERELTEVRPAGDGTVWQQPTQAPEEFGPAYEAPYAGRSIGTPSPGPAWDLPCAFHTAGSWLLAGESDLRAGFFGSHLDDGYAFVPPLPGEGDGVGGVDATVTLPWTSPWRFVVVGDRAGVLVESSLADHLATPSRLGDISWIRPGRVSWSWWSDTGSPRDLAKLRDFVDLAHEFGWEYSLVDANWNEHSEASMRELVRYAADRGVRLWLWYNSGGAHNHVTEQPRDRLTDRDVRRAELAKLAEWGVAGIKVDFFHSDKADGIARYLDILTDAAELKIMVNFHGCTIPRGWTRTWPHLLSMEGVRGAENYLFDPEFPAVAPRHNTILPFTRNAIGPMDYTPVTFTRTAHPHLTTGGHELALAVVFESGLLHLADSATAYRSLPPAVASALRHIPVVWDETRCLTGEPGSPVAVARRHGAEWWVGAISGEPSPATLDVDLAALAAGPWHVIGDDLTGRPAGGPFTVAPYGGFLATTTALI
jgi:hypothetical protein